MGKTIMGKSDIVRMVAKVTGHTQATVDDVMTIGIHIMARAAAQGNHVQWPGFGTLYTTLHKGYSRGIDIKPTEPRIVVRFRPYAAFKAAANDLQAAKIAGRK